MSHPPQHNGRMRRERQVKETKSKTKQRKTTREPYTRDPRLDTIAYKVQIDGRNISAVILSSPAYSIMDG
jgi:hypothetical protein